MNDHDDNGFGSGKYPGQPNGPERELETGHVVLAILGVVAFFLIVALLSGWAGS